MTEDYANLIEVIAAAHKRGHLIALACVVESGRNRMTVDVVGEGSALETLADQIKDAVSEKLRRQAMN